VARASGSAVLCKRVRGDDTNSASSSKHSPLGSPRGKPHFTSRCVPSAAELCEWCQRELTSCSPSVMPLSLDPVIEDSFDLKTSVTTEQVPLRRARRAMPHVQAGRVVRGPTSQGQSARFPLVARDAWP
jgi:hypothetical protein